MADLHCPSCAQPLSVETFEGHYGAKVELDLCHSCELIWFDKLENIQLSANGALGLLRSMATGLDPQRQPLPDRMDCPRCTGPLRQEVRRKKGSQWQVRACRQSHGQLVRYFDFLVERDCVKPLQGERLEELKRNVQQIRCSGCGSPVDIHKHDACQACGAPLSVLDAAATANAISQLREQGDADKEQAHPELVAAEMMMAKARTERAYRQMEREHGSRYRSTAGGVVAEGLIEVALRFLFDW